MFLPGKRKGASFLIMVVIMAVVMSMFAISVSQLSRSRSSTLISDATEKQVLYLAEDAVNQMILQLHKDSSSKSISSPDPLDIGATFRYDAVYTEGTEPFNPTSSGTVRGTGYCVTATGTYSKTVYLEVQETGSGLAGVKRTWREDY
ncbi:MAG: hypothetical protein WC625_02030 [Caldisericia bacterium]